MHDTIGVHHGEVTIETYAQGEGSAFVILPSYGRDGGEDFDIFADALADAGYRALRPQPRGIHGSTGPLEDVTLEDLADDVAAVVTELQAGPAVVLGHAFGAFVARALATNHPELVSGVVIAAGSAEKVDPDVGSAPFRAGDPSLPRDQRLAVLRSAFFAPGHDATVWLDGWYPGTLAMQHAAIQSADIPHYWGAGSAPILEIIAACDPFQPPDTRGQLRSRYGDRVTSEVIADASHALFPEQPDAVAETVIRALARA